VKRRLIVFALCLAVVGCTTDPYTAAIKGSADVSQAVSSAVKITASYYTSGKLSDAKKSQIGSVLNVVTDCNTTFRKAVVDAHKAGQTGVTAFFPIANSFVVCAQMTPQIKSDPEAMNILKAVDTAVNGVSLAVSNAKGK
jgi:hypothetical protein